MPDTDTSKWFFLFSTTVEEKKPPSSHGEDYFWLLIHKINIKKMRKTFLNQYLHVILIIYMNILNFHQTLIEPLFSPRLSGRFCLSSSDWRLIIQFSYCTVLLMSRYNWLCETLCHLRTCAKPCSLNNTHFNNFIV